MQPGARAPGEDDAAHVFPYRSKVRSCRSTDAALSSATRNARAIRAPIAD
jgi:hypothetical protein